MRNTIFRTTRLVRTYYKEVAAVAVTSIFLLATRFMPKGSTTSSSFLKIDKPDVVWFMSYPDTGSMYVLAQIEKMVQNQIEEHEVELEFSSIPDGPAMQKSVGFPHKNLVLSNTHCGGHCFSKCMPSEFMITKEQFLLRCSDLERPELAQNGEGYEIKRGFHSLEEVEKVVILLRSPFSSIVSRFNYEYRLHHAKSSEDSFQGWPKAYTKNIEGFRQWCSDIDNSKTEEENRFFKSSTLALLQSVPCHTELFKYIQWHNFAFDILSEKKLHTLYYEEPFMHPKTALNDLFRFLGVESQETSFEFLVREYAYYYTTFEKEKIIMVMKKGLSDTATKYLDRYLIGPEY